MGALACKAKIILDSSSAAGYAQAIANAVFDVDEKVLTDEAAYPIICKLIEAERALVDAHLLFLDAIGYEGPRP